MTHRISILALLAVAGSVSAAHAQTYAIASDLLFYGDNTEFTNPFRSGETILGASGRVWLDITFNETVTLRGGLFGAGRFGSHEFLEHAEPAIALELSRGASRFIFGSLETVTTRHDVEGPDVETLHGLLPPLQEETLTFTRGQEMGLQWLVGSEALEQDAWINWQRLNTRESRERFDAGYRASVGLPASLRLQGQWHVVHEGGQQFHHGPVKDSQAVALGLQWAATAGSTRTVLEAHAVATEDVPDRKHDERTEAGLGLFTRAAIERHLWRGHVIVWRSRDTLKAEGDANYLARRRDGTMFRNVRDYAEFGLTRRFNPAPGVNLFAAVRLHKIDSQYEYSYRVVARLHLRRPL